MPLKKLLSHTKTKAELTAFLAKKVRESGWAVGEQIVVACGTDVKRCTKACHEEADTRRILHALGATNDCATKLSIHSPDTNVLVLAIRWCSEMCSNISFVTGKGKSH